VTIELADDPKLARDISAGGVFVPGCKLKINSDCSLVVRGPAEEIELEARVVYVDPKTGAGLELVNFTPAMRDHLTKLMSTWSTPIDLGIDTEGETLDMVADDDDEATAARLASAARSASLGSDAAAVEDAAGDPEAVAGTDDAETREADTAEAGGNTDEDPADEPDPVKRSKALNLHERLRGLTLAQQIKHASSGDPQERILLERFYGKNVWEALLRNPRLTPPEVARISRMGTLPRVLVEIIVTNGAWLGVPEVRRALLTNPRLGTDQIMRVLRMMPKHELKVLSGMGVYPYAVRDVAKRLLREPGGG
jgi:hypothetical protein